MRVNVMSMAVVTVVFVSMACDRESALLPRGDDDSGAQALDARPGDRSHTTMPTEADGAAPTDGPALVADVRGPSQPVDGRVPSRSVYLMFADGGPAPGSLQGSLCANAPPFACSDGVGNGTEDCKQKILAHLERWYRDFSVSFTLLRPTTASYQTIFVANQIPWMSGGSCMRQGGCGGISSTSCTDKSAAVSLAAALATSALQSAASIARVHGWQMGIQKASGGGVMASCSDPEPGFEDREYPVTSDSQHCGATQNAYRLMLERLGPR